MKDMIETFKLLIKPFVTNQLTQSLLILQNTGCTGSKSKKPKPNKPEAGPAIAGSGSAKAAKKGAGKR